MIDMPDLPSDIDATYPDRSPGDAAHQQHHDAIHAALASIQAAGGAATGSDVSAAGIDSSVAALVPDVGTATGGALDGRYGRKIAVDVREFGAVGDGVADDTAAFISACQAATVVLAPAGTYKLTSTVTLPTGCELRGIGRKATTLSTNGDYPALTMIGGEGQAIRDLRISNAYTGTRTTHDITIVNPFNPHLEDVEVALSQSSLAKGGISITKDTGQAGSENSFMPVLTNVFIRNGTLYISGVTDGKVTGGWVWATYTGAPGAIELGASSSNWTFVNVDVVPSANAGYLVSGGLSNLSIISGLMDGSYDTITTGWGIKTTGYVRGMTVTGVKFWNLSLGGMWLDNVRRAVVTGNVFSQGNKGNGGVEDIRLTSGSVGNAFVGNSFGAPAARTTKGRIYTEDATSVDNTFTGNVMELNGGSNNYLTPLTAADARAVHGNIPGTAAWGQKRLALLTPPLSLLATISASAWPAANTAIFQRLTVPEGTTVRYLNLRVDGASGNMHAGIARLSGSGLTTWTTVASTGVVAATAGDLHLDLSATPIGAGEYAVFLWFDNNTATTRVASNSGVASTRLAAEKSSLTGGVPSTGTVAWNSARFLGGVTVEADV